MECDDYENMQTMTFFLCNDETGETPIPPTRQSPAEVSESIIASPTTPVPTPLATEGSSDPSKSDSRLSLLAVYALTLLGFQLASSWS